MVRRENKSYFYPSYKLEIGSFVGKTTGEAVEDKEEKNCDLGKLKETLILEPWEQKPRLMTDKTGVREAPNCSKRRSLTCLAVFSQHRWNILCTCVQCSIIYHTKTTDTASKLIGNEWLVITI